MKTAIASWIFIFQNSNGLFQFVRKQSIREGQSISTIDWFISDFVDFFLNS